MVPRLFVMPAGVQPGAKIEMRDSEGRIDIDGTHKAGDGGVTMAGRSMGQTEIGMNEGDIGRHCQRPPEQLNRLVMPPLLVSQQRGEMQSVGMFGLRRQNLPVQHGGLVQLPGLVQCKRALERFVGAGDAHGARLRASRPTSDAHRPVLRVSGQRCQVANGRLCGRSRERGSRRTPAKDGRDSGPAQA